MSGIIGGICILLGLMLMGTMYMFAKKNRESKMYAKYIEIIENDIKKSKKKKEKQRDLANELLPIGIIVYDTFKSVRNTLIYKKIEYKFINIYGEKYREYIKAYISKSITIFLFLVSIVTFFTGIIIISSDDGVKVVKNTIERPEIGVGVKEVEVIVEVKKGEEVEKSIEVIEIEDKKYTKEELLNVLDEIFIEKNILWENIDLKNVKSNLCFFNSFKGFDNKKYEIRWTSSDEKIINNSGELFSEGSDGKEVKLTAVIVEKESFNVIWEKSFDVVVREKGPESDSDIVSGVIGSIKKFISNNDENIEIPSEIEGTTVIVRAEDKRFKIIGQACLILLIIFVVVTIDFKENIDKKIKVKKQTILYEFPDFLNKLLLLLNAGMNIKDSWIKVANDSERNNLFYDLVYETAFEIKETGISEMEAYEEFKLKCTVPEVSKFINIIKQNLKKGNAELEESLELLSKDCWQIRINIAKERGKEASSKLLLPMFLMLMLIIFVVGFAAIQNI